MKPIAVVDTQVWVSGLLNDAGAAAKVVHAFADGLFTLAISDPVLDEYERVLHSFAPLIGTNVTDEVLGLLLESAVIVAPSPLPLLCRDPSDNKVLECAVAARAGFLVTKNIKHFPAHYGATRVVRISEFLCSLGR